MEHQNTNPLPPTPQKEKEKQHLSRDRSVHPRLSSPRQYCYTTKLTKASSLYKARVYPNATKFIARYYSYMKVSFIDVCVVEHSSSDAVSMLYTA